MPSIEEFKSLMKDRGGLAMANRYRVVFSLPNAVRQRMQGPVGNSLNLMCDATGLPGRQIATLDYQAQKQVIKVPYGFLNEDVTFTFLLTGDYLAKKVFDAWSEAVIDFKSYRVKYMDDFTSTVSIYQTAKGGDPEAFKRAPDAPREENLQSNPSPTPNEGEVVLMKPFVVQESRVTDEIDLYAVKLLRAYPVTFSGINLDNAGENTIQKYQIVMTYENFETIEIRK